MTNAFYNPTGNPASNSEGLSSVMRTEFALIGAGFDNVPQILTTGAFSTTFAQVADVILTLPGINDTLATLGGTETFTNKTLTSPILTGTPVAPTATPSTTNTTQIATTAFVQAASFLTTLGLPGKIVFRDITVQWNNEGSISDGATVNFPTAFSSAPFVGCWSRSTTVIVSAPFTVSGSSFAAIIKTAAGGSTSCLLSWLAIGPT